MKVYSDACTCIRTKISVFALNSQGAPLCMYTMQWVPIHEMPVGWGLDGLIWKTAELKSSSNEI